jgi:hypothetical protein
MCREVGSGAEKFNQPDKFPAAQRSSIISSKILRTNQVQGRLNLKNYYGAVFFNTLPDFCPYQRSDAGSGANHASYGASPAP